MSETLTYFGTLHIEHCPSCQIRFAFPVELEQRMRDDHEQWRFCPNGHRFHYNTTDPNATSRLKARIAALEADADHQRQMRADAERRLVTAKAQATKLRKRAAAGVCPCCQRTFVELARHMTTQHPNYATTAEQ